jgi:inner membrane protein
MDSLTHIVLGACIGEAIGRRRFGKPALFMGALANSLPDIDFMGVFFLDTADNLLAHRGITHSVLFAVLSTFFLSLLIKLFMLRKASMRVLLWLIGVNIFTHLFIDAFNAYGTGWWEPFSHQRISFHSLFVADPLFTIAPLVAVIMLLLLRNAEKCRLWWKIGVIVPAAYLLVTLVLKQIVEEQVKQAVFKQQIEAKSFLTTPAPFNSLLWFVAVRTDSGYYTGYHSVLDKDGKMLLKFKPQSRQLLSTVQDKEEANKLLRFADGYYTLSRTGDTTVLNVLRFGQVVGWYDTAAPFVFHYYLDRPGANLLVTQRGRFERWNDTTFHSLWQRMKGN